VGDRPTNLVAVSETTVTQARIELSLTTITKAKARIWLWWRSNDNRKES